MRLQGRAIRTSAAVCVRLQIPGFVPWTRSAYAYGQPVHAVWVGKMIRVRRLHPLWTILFALLACGQPDSPGTLSVMATVPLAPSSIPTESPIPPLPTVPQTPAPCLGGVAICSPATDVPDSAWRDSSPIPRSDPQGNGIWHLVAGGPELGTFKRPKGLAVDAKGWVYVADSGNDRIQVLDPYGVPRRRVGERGTLDGQFHQPSAVLVRRVSEDVLVADTGNNRTQAIHWTTQPYRNLEPEAPPFEPIGIAESRTDSKLYVLNGRDGRITVWEGQRPSGFRRLTLLSDISEARGLAVGAYDSVYVTKVGRVQARSRDGTLTEWLLPSPGSAGPPTPIGIAVDSRTDSLIVADPAYHRVLKLSATGAVLAEWQPMREGAPLLVTPWGVAVSRDGEVFVSDAGSNRIVKLSADGAVLAVWGHDDDPNRITFAEPRTMAVRASESARDVFIAQAGPDQITRVSRAGTRAEVWQLPTTEFGGMALGAGSELYIADAGHDRILKLAIVPAPGSPIVDRRTETEVVVAWGTHGSGPGQFRSPQGIFVAESRYRTYPAPVLDAEAQGIYVADTGNHRIQKLALDGAPIAQWGRAGRGPGEFSRPIGVAVGPDGSIYVLDAGNHRIQKLDRDGRPIAQWGSPGTGPSQFVDPTAIAIDPRGNLFVADPGAGRILYFFPNGVQFEEQVIRNGDGEILAPVGVAVGERHGSSGPLQIRRYVIFDLYATFRGTEGVVLTTTLPGDAYVNRTR
jgi:tripartite motif-containing protein 71